MHTMCHLNAAVLLLHDEKRRSTGKRRTSMYKRSIHATVLHNERRLYDILMLKPAADMPIQLNA